MRNLSVKQKKALKELFNRTHDVDQIDEFDRIYDMNPHECYYQNAQRFLQDLNEKIFLDNPMSL